MEIKHTFECSKCKKPIDAVIKSKGRSTPQKCPHCGVEINFSDVEKKLSGIEASFGKLGGQIKVNLKL